MRLKVALAAMEEIIKGVHKDCANPQPSDNSYQELAQQIEWKSGRQRELATQMMAKLLEWGEQLEAEGEKALAPGAPRPRPELRLRPRI